MSEVTALHDRVTDVLADTRISHHRSYYPAGEVDGSAVVVSVQRVSDEDYQRLASGACDYRPQIVPDVTA